MLDARLLIIGCTWPEPKSTAAGGRMQRLIQFFIENQCEITFASSANLVESSLNLEALGISKEGILLNDDSFDDFIKKLAPDIVLFDRFLMEEQFGWRVAEHAPNALRILDTEDLHSIRISRETAFKKNLEWNADYWLASDQTKREIASIYRCDFSLIISSFEMQLLKEVLHIASDLLLYLPFMVKDVSKDQIQAWPKYEDRKDFVFIGTGKHAPNIDAIRWLKKDIWPTIKKALPAARLYVCGSYLPDHIRQMQDTKAGFNVVGEVAAEAEIIQSKRINLAPLRFGAGLKGKLLSGMHNGTPNISTTIGAEGMLNDLPWSGLIADNAEEFAMAALSLYNDKNQWQQAQKNGIAIVNTTFKAATHKAKLLQKIIALRSDLKQHRRKNFIGALLQQQTMASTKYMSKWIAEKNKV